MEDYKLLYKISKIFNKIMPMPIVRTNNTLLPVTTTLPWEERWLPYRSDTHLIMRHTLHTALFYMRPKYHRISRICREVLEICEQSL